MKYLLLYLLLLPHTVFSIEALKSCGVCHQISEQQGECVKCHSSKQKKAQWNQLYQFAPSFNNLSLPFEVRYNLTGLKKYLANPVKRTADPGHMFPVLPSVVEKVINTMASCHPKSFAGDPNLILEGKKLYEQYQCSYCHEDIRKAPRLRIGIPLLSLRFWKKKLAGQDRVYHPKYLLKMPRYNLDDHEIKAIYSFAAMTRSEQSYHRDYDANKSYPSKGRAVLASLHRGGCVHCHFAEMSPDSLIGVFGNSYKSFELTAKNRRLAFDPEAMSVFQMNDSCQSSRILDMLNERIMELKGIDNPNIRGMPITLPAFHPKEIELIKEWSKQGCESEGQKLCTPCRHDIEVKS